jgi:flagellar hook protein FlgE
VKQIRRHDFPEKTVVPVATTTAVQAATATFTTDQATYNAAKSVYDAATATYNGSLKDATAISDYETAIADFRTAGDNYETAIANYGTALDGAASSASLALGPIGRILSFGTNGALTSPAIASLPAGIAVPGADPLFLSYDLTGTTQFGSPTGVNSLSQDGNAAGQLTGIDVSKTGVVTARYSSGAFQSLGQVILGRFPNTQGLQKLGNTSWGQSSSSGQPVEGLPGANNIGTIQAGGLEASNVDLANQLVNLIVAQQSYQANAQTITTENEIIRTLLQLR